MTPNVDVLFPIGIRTEKSGLEMLLYEDATITTHHVAIEQTQAFSI